jgi:hypothetical protein
MLLINLAHLCQFTLTINHNKNFTTLAHLKRIVARSLLNWSTISTAVEQKNTPSAQGTRTGHREARAHRGRHPPHVDTERRESQQQQEREQTCKPHENQAAVGRRSNNSAGCPEDSGNSGRRRYRCSDSGGERSPGVGLRRRASLGGWLQRRRDTRGRRGAPPPAQQRASTQVHSERSMCSNPQQTRGTTVASDERRDTTALPEGTSVGRTAAAASILRHGRDLVEAWWAPTVSVGVGGGSLAA